MFFVPACSFKNEIDSNYYCQKLKLTCTKGNKIIYFKTSKGDFEVKLLGKDYPVTVSNFLENINNSYDSFSTIIGSQIQDGNIKINLDTSFERSPNYIEDKDVTWNSRLIGQLMGDITYDLKKNLNKNFSFNPELTFGGRTLFLGKNQIHFFYDNH